MIKSIPNREVIKVSSALEDSIDCGDRLVEGHIELFSFKDHLKNHHKINKPLLPSQKKNYKINHQFSSPYLPPNHTNDDFNNLEYLTQSSHPSPKSLLPLTLPSHQTPTFNSSQNPGENIHQLFINILNELFTDYDFSDLPPTAFQRISPSDLASELNINLLQHLQNTAPQTYQKLSALISLAHNTSRMVPFIWRGGAVQFAAETDESLPEDLQTHTNLSSVDTMESSESFAIEAASEDAFGIKLPARQSVIIAESIKRSDDDDGEGQQDDDDEHNVDTTLQESDAIIIVSDNQNNADSNAAAEPRVSSCVVPPASLLTEAELANAAQAGMGLVWSADVFIIDTVEKSVLYIGSCTRDKSAAMKQKNKHGGKLNAGEGKEDNDGFPKQMGRFFQYHTSVLRGASPILYPMASPKTVATGSTGFLLEPMAKYPSPRNSSSSSSMVVPKFSSPAFFARQEAEAELWAGEMTSGTTTASGSMFSLPSRVTTCRSVTSGSSEDERGRMQQQPQQQSAGDWVLGPSVLMRLGKVRESEI